MTARQTRAARDPLDFLAFRELVSRAYLRYARARLDAPALAQAAVDAAFVDIRRCWPQALSSASAPQAAWRHLRHAVTRYPGHEAASQPWLAGACEDATLLHRHAGMPVEDIASVMGVSVACVRVLLARADRESAGRVH
ncbi:sigma-70 region 4 domain-containing protein [Streptomyces buecherae]|uniref:Sigma-70 region 4 domain-containing protein n=1 Tax=Streptomyces buecherae TaxID=2763006 RepID=A0A7H8NGW5_9ACTN|nr:sigma-70 region 4 domain-containing protein [Streptomyces buecherae]QKW53753.1 sigma-70 region 4 domain-containing protein [Streptomyces buecherae]